MAFFVSVPLASVAHTFRSNNRLGAFWGTFFIIFVCTALGCVLFYAKYCSHYATKLLDRAAAEVSNDARLQDDLLDDNVSESGSYAASVSKWQSRYNGERKRFPSVTIGAEEELRRINGVDAQSVETNGYESPDTITNISTGPSSENDHEEKTEHSPAGQSDPSADRASGEHIGVTTDRVKSELRVHFEEVARNDCAAVNVDDGQDQGLLRLYQVSMLVERLFGSSYFDDQWAIGLSEDRLYEAIVQILNSDGALGRQFAAFSFTAVAISSKGTSLGPGSEAVAASGVRFSFGLFGLLAASGFLCGLTSSLLADFMLRKLNLTQTKEDKTSHEFADEFGFYLRMNGGLNGFAGRYSSSFSNVSPSSAVKASLSSALAKITYQMSLMFFFIPFFWLSLCGLSLRNIRHVSSDGNFSFSAVDFRSLTSSCNSSCCHLATRWVDIDGIIFSFVCVLVAQRSV